MRSVMNGSPGKWLALEALPAYILIFAVWPLMSGFQGSVGWLSGFVRIYSSADCAAVAVCFLITAFFDLGRYQKNEEIKDLDRNWWMPGAIALSWMLSMLVYVAVKLNPVDVIQETCIPLKAYIYCALSWLIAIGTSWLVYHSRR